MEIFMNNTFMIFAPTVCHSHTITLCMAGRRDSVNGVATYYRLDSWIWAPVARDFLFLLPVWTSPGAHQTVFIVGTGPLSLKYRSQIMELITHLKLVLILRICIAIPLLLLCATIGMIWSDIYLLHMCGWLFMNSVFMYLHKRKATNNKSVKSKEFTKKFCFFLFGSSYWEI
jgi:hypothetical protein